MTCGHFGRMDCKMGSVDLWLRTRTTAKMAPTTGAKSISAKTSSNKCGGKGSPGIVQKGGGWGGVTDARTNSRNSQPVIDSNFLAIQFNIFPAAVLETSSPAFVPGSSWKKGTNDARKYQAYWAPARESLELSISEKTGEIRDTQFHLKEIGWTTGRADRCASTRTAPITAPKMGDAIMMLKIHSAGSLYSSYMGSHPTASPSVWPTAYLMATSKNRAPRNSNDFLFILVLRYYH